MSYEAIIKYYNCFVCILILFIRHANRVFSAPHLCPLWLYRIFQHYVMNLTFFASGKIIEPKICLDLLYNFCLKLFFPRRFQPDVIINARRPSCKSRVILVTFNKVYIFSADTGKGLVKFHENPYNGSQVFSLRADRQTDRMKDEQIYIYICVCLCLCVCVCICWCV